MSVTHFNTGGNKVLSVALLKEIEELRSAPIDRLRVKYRQVFQEEPRSKHREQLFRRVAWRMQAQAGGGLSDGARQRALAIANEADLRVIAPRSIATPFLAAAPARFDPRIPVAGTVLTRRFRDRTVLVKVMKNGFEYQGRRYGSLSAIASEVTGTRWNGIAFFGLTGVPKKAKGSHGCSK
jgi:Protein of unknown function (DUF2924)